MKAVVSIYHDTRHQKKDGTYPVKIRVYDGWSTKFHPTGIDLTESDFAKVLSGRKVTGDLLDKQKAIEEKKVKANEVVKKMDSFNHTDFQKRFLNQNGSDRDIFHYYGEQIKYLAENDQVKSSILYQHASDSFKRFLQPKPTKAQPLKTTTELRADKSLRLPFRDVNIKWLNKYQKWMTEKENSLTTIGMYLRTLRAIFNVAVADKEISSELYPFGKNQFTIPSGNTGGKEVLHKQDLKKVLRTLWDYKTEDELIIKARDFWFFIFSGYGMNVRDIVQLKDTNILGNSIFYVRQKTKNKSKKTEPIEVPITGHMQHVIDKYGTAGPYIFGVINPEMDEAKKVAACDAFTTFINNGMERLCKQTGVMLNCNTYAARHLFATMTIRNGQSTAFVQKALGHKSIMTTEFYIGDFDSEEKRKVSDQNMNF